VPKSLGERGTPTGPRRSNQFDHPHLSSAISQLFPSTYVVIRSTAKLYSIEGKVTKNWIIKTLICYATANAGRQLQTPLIHREGQARVFFIDKVITSTQESIQKRGISHSEKETSFSRSSSR
jgi:hypothetical protein